MIFKHSWARFHKRCKFGPMGEKIYCEILTLSVRHYRHYGIFIAVGDTPLCDNAFCGAESGVIPVSTTSPAVLLSNLELQAGEDRRVTQYLLPMPHERQETSDASPESL